MKVNIDFHDFIYHNISTMQTDRAQSKTVYVAMSGGVDSSVAAALLKQQGYHVVGVFFKPWQPEDGQAFCNWQQDRQDALNVAARLGIELKTWDYSSEYGQAVTHYMIEAYRQGITPNPDIMCNKEIKFGLFLKQALAEGADYIATGHYARIRSIKYQELRSTYQLLKARDTNKDQSYFLYTLTQEQLRHCLFPIGDYEKPAVRQLAREFDLLTYNKKDSQGICFVGELNMKDFLKRYITPTLGEIKLLATGETIGTHDGVAYYTIGQRHGLHLGNPATGGGGPYYIAHKDTNQNIIYVSPIIDDLKASQLTAKELTWTQQPQQTTSLQAQAKIRYRTATIPVTIELTKQGSALVSFAQPVQAVTPGQSIVFYDGELVLGGGIIDAPRREE